jgi:hypothetical protein
MTFFRSPISRASRSIRVTTRVSPGRMNDSIASSSTRPARLVPLTFSSRIGSQPAAASRSRCTLSSWSVLLTRAYPIFIASGF